MATGCGAAQLCLTPGEAQPNPVTGASLPGRTASEMPNVFVKREQKKFVFYVERIKSRMKFNLIAHRQLFAPYGDDKSRSLVYTGFGSLVFASPGVKHGWAASQPIFPILPYPLQPP